jgi:cytochrome c-type biogenesis protein CcmE
MANSSFAPAVRQRKKQRLLLAIVALAAIAIAGIIAVFALRDTAAYFHAPTDLLSERPAPGTTFRLGGLVKPGSLRHLEDGVTLDFTVTDNQAETEVSYRGLVPDLFREGQGVIATGSLDAGGVFHAEQLLAKHDENYVPPEVAKALERTHEELKTRAAAGA